MYERCAVVHSCVTGKLCMSCLQEDKVQACPALTACEWKTLRAEQSITMTRVGWGFIHSTGDLMAQLHQGN